MYALTDMASILFVLVPMCRQRSSFDFHLQLSREVLGEQLMCESGCLN